jgi:hypothetical protein
MANAPAACSTPREANAPLTGDQITEHVMEDRGFDAEDDKMRRLMLNRVRPCLRALRRKAGSWRGKEPAYGAAVISRLS